MEERIKRLQEMTLSGQMWVNPVCTEYDRKDIFLRPVQMSAKRVAEYILNQEPLITEYSALTGFLTFDGSVEGEIFNRYGHKNFEECIKFFYNQPVDSVATFEWQHSTGDFNKIIHCGLKQILIEIDESIRTHHAVDELDFLNGLKTVTLAIIGWAEKCSNKAKEKSETVQNPEQKKNLLRLARTLKYIPYEPASNFYEAVLCLFICYPFVPDSIGTIDRYFREYYLEDLNTGKITTEEASSLLQELYLMLQARIKITSDRFTRGGESHFCIGGYLPNGEDGFTETSRLVLDSLLELDTYIPQISLRWTKKTPEDVFYYVNDRARKDAHQRIAFVNDEPRIDAWMNIAGMSYENAVSYTMVGCNEPAMPGGMIMGSCQGNLAKFIPAIFQKHRKEIIAADSFDAFFAIAEVELHHNLDEIIRYDELFNTIRARDCNLVSSIFFRGCIKNAKSISQGGGDFTTGMLDVIGSTTAIDSLAIVRQFVYDEKLCTMQELADAIAHNWAGYDDLHTLILHKGRFFGNDDEQTNEVAQRFYESIYQYLLDKRDFGGNRFLLGDLIGYNQHNVWFGAATAATPDGRYAGEPISFGRGQNHDKDRNGLTALLNSVACCDPRHLVSGPTVTNIMLDEQMVRDDKQFCKLVFMLETYFKKGGIHYQLSYVSRDELIAAQKDPANYQSLRVRVSGFSDFFVRLNSDLQDEIITRTSQHT